MASNITAVVSHATQISTGTNNASYPISKDAWNGNGSHDVAVTVNSLDAAQINNAGNLTLDIANAVVTTDGAGKPVASTTTPTQLNFSNSTTSNVQTQFANVNTSLAAKANAASLGNLALQNGTNAILGGNDTGAMGAVTIAGNATYNPANRTLTVSGGGGGGGNATPGGPATSIQANIGGEFNGTLGHTLDLADARTFTGTVVADGLTPLANMTGLGLWMLFEEGSGTNVIDYSGNNNNGTSENCTYSPDAQQGKFSLDAFTLSGNVTIPSSPSISPDDVVTVCFWAKVTDFGSFGDTNYFFAKRGPGGGPSDYWMTVDAANTVLNFAWNSTLGGGSATTSYSIPDSEWHHYLAYFDSPEGGEWYLRVDGVEIANGTAVHTDPISQNGLDLSIGDDGHGSNNRFPGLIDNFMIFTRELETDEFAILARRGSIESRGDVSARRDLSGKTLTLPSYANTPFFCGNGTGGVVPGTVGAGLAFDATNKTLSATGGGGNATTSAGNETEIQVAGPNGTFVAGPTFAFNGTTLQVGPSPSVVTTTPRTLSITSDSFGLVILEGNGAMSIALTDKNASAGNKTFIISVDAGKITIGHCNDDATDGSQPRVAHVANGTTYFPSDVAIGQTFDGATPPANLSVPNGSISVAQNMTLPIPSADFLKTDINGNIANGALAGLDSALGMNTGMATDGTYPLPTSITIKNGRITAIS